MSLHVCAMDASDRRCHRWHLKRLPKPNSSSALMLFLYKLVPRALFGACCFFALEAHSIPHYLNRQRSEGGLQPVSARGTAGPMQNRWPSHVQHPTASDCSNYCCYIIISFTKPDHTSNCAILKYTMVYYSQLA